MFCVRNKFSHILSKLERELSFSPLTLDHFLHTWEKRAWSANTAFKRNPKYNQKKGGLSDASETGGSAVVVKKLFEALKEDLLWC